MSMLVQCSLNVSEGRRKEVIEALSGAVAGVDGVTVLEVDPSPASNRTVLSFAGPPDAVIEAALMGARACAQLIDMTRHRGDHPRLGAVDACPFIPVRNTTVEDCVHCAKIFASKVAEELSIPIYLYGDASPEGERRTVQELRRGEYESLPERFSGKAAAGAEASSSVEGDTDSSPVSRVAPDFGPAEFVPPWGATMVGARQFVLAYSVNLLCPREVAQDIAARITAEGEGGAGLVGVQAAGWFLEEHNVAQVTTNITNPDVTGLHAVYEAVCKEAEAQQVAVVGSQVVGVLPLKCLLDAANFYAERQGLFILEEDQRVRLAVQRLGLNSLTEFSPKEKVIDFLCEDAQADGPLLSQDLRALISLIGGRSQAPGAGSAAAIMASLGCALCTMSGLLSCGDRRMKEIESSVRLQLPGCYTAMKEALPMVDEDAAALADYRKIRSLIAEGEEELASKTELEQRLLRRRLTVPLALINQIKEISPMAAALASIVSLENRADMLTALRCLEAALWSCSYIIRDLLASVSDEEIRGKMAQEVDDAIGQVEPLQSAIKALEARE